MSYFPRPKRDHLQLTIMSTKERILQLASDPIRGKILSAQVIKANKTGAPVVNVEGDTKFRLVRISEVSIKPKQ